LDGTVIAESDYDPAKMENHLQRPEVQMALTGNDATDIRYSVTLKTNFLYAAVPITVNSSVFGVARVAVSTQSVDHAVKNIQITIFQRLPSYLQQQSPFFLSQHIFRSNRCAKLTQFAADVSGSKPEVGIKQKYNDEIHQLEFAINQMANDLLQQVDNYKTESVQLSSILSTMSDGIIIVDQDGIVKLINPAATNLSSHLLI